MTASALATNAASGAIASALAAASSLTSNPPTNAQVRMTVSRSEHLQPHRTEPDEPHSDDREVAAVDEIGVSCPLRTHVPRLSRRRGEPQLTERRPTMTSSCEKPNTNSSF